MKFPSTSHKIQCIAVYVVWAAADAATGVHVSAARQSANAPVVLNYDGAGVVVQTKKTTDLKVPEEKHLAQESCGIAAVTLVAITATALPLLPSASCRAAHALIKP